MRPPAERWLVVGFGVLSFVGILLGGDALAQSSTMHVHVTAGGCPSAALVSEQLNALVRGGVEVVPREAVPEVRENVATVVDKGQDYVVELGDLRRVVRDPDRACVERAQVAAVFIVLNLYREAAPGGPEPLRASRVHVGGWAFGALAMASEASGVAPGVGAGLWLQHGMWHLAVDMAWQASTRVGTRSGNNPSSGHVSLTRLPLSLQLSQLFEIGAGQLGPLLALDLDVLRMRGERVPDPQTAWRANVGLGLGLHGRLRLGGRVQLVLQGGAVGFARAYRLDVDPALLLGHTPRLWGFVRLGLALPVS